MEKLREFQVEVDVNASKEQVWDLLFNRFGEVNIFNPVIEGSHHASGSKGEVGCERICDIDSKTSVKERITAASGNDSFDIEIIESTMPMMNKMFATWGVKDIGFGMTRAQITIRFNTKPAFMGAIMKGMMKGMIKKMVIGLKYHMETGDVVTKDKIKGIAKDYKQLKGNEAFSAKLKAVAA
jgi:ribosome-associated toxin RatA of RatAB toxin-antitoxin module